MAERAAQPRALRAAARLRRRIFPRAALLLLAPSLALALALVPSRSSAASASKAPPAAVEKGGTVAGIVSYAGKPPAPARIEITKDRAVCGRIPLYDESLIVGKDGGLANAVVTITGAGVAPPRPLKDVRFDQKDCEYVPHVLAAPVGSTIDIINSDAILHNIHSYPLHGMGIDMAQPGFKRVIKVAAKSAGPVRIDCDAHNWMRGWWYMVTTPYYALTGAKGRFAIKDVPPGSYTLKVWQEKLGVITRQIVVKPGAVLNLALTMGAKAK